MEMKTIDELYKAYFNPEKETSDEALQLWVYEIVGLAQSNIQNWFETKRPVAIACCKTLEEIDFYIKELASYCYYEGIPFARKEKFTFIIHETAFSCFRYYEDFKVTEMGSNIWRGSLLDLPIWSTRPNLKDMGKEFGIKGYTETGTVISVEPLNTSLYG